jgi:hypothetical protein
MAPARPIGIFYEHPHWFEPLFAELSRREIPHVKIDAARHGFDPERVEDFALVFNRMSPSAWKRGHGEAIFYTRDYLTHLESGGVPVFNGSRAFSLETSKAQQVSLLERLRLPVPRTRVVNHPSLLPRAARELEFPLVVKPNVGGSGAGIVRFNSPADLQAAVVEERLSLGFDRVALVQEFIPARGGHIVRVECVGGKYVYAIKVHLSGETFDLCPADICQTGAGVALDNACPVEAPKAGLRVDAYQPPPGVIRAVERLLTTMGIDVGGVEYIVDDRDGQLYYYDVNALSNFVADAPRVLGFDPFVNLGDYLVSVVEAAAHV